MIATRKIDYEKPPVIETALGLVFAPVRGWNLLHYGLLWSIFRERYPFAEVRLPAGAVQFDQLDLKLGPEIQLGGLPLRCWFLDEKKNQLIQVQANTFIRNWRAIESEQKYVHYAELKPIFEKDWNLYKRFLRGEELPDPEVYLCEATYVNHLVKGREWNTLEDIKKIFKGLSLGLNADLTSISFTAKVATNDLQLVTAPAIRADGVPILQVTITVTGKPASSSDGDVLSKLDECHDGVVKTFADITADELQNAIWRRI